MSKGRLNPALVVFLGCIGAGQLSAQTAGTGALTGTVTDPGGAVLPRVTVAVTNIGSGQERSAVSGADGSYTVTLLPPGAYKVRFSASGFKTAEVGPVTITVTETPVLNRTLEIGSQTEQVTVEANAEAVQASNATLGTVVSTRTVTDLPLNTRNYTNLLALSAGVNSTVNNATAIGKGSQDFAVNGSSNAQNNFAMDGVSIQNYGGQGTTHEGGSYTSFGIPSPDAIQEFKIQTSQYDAGYGRNPGANVNVMTKSGTNQFHGTAFEFFRNTDLNANDFFLNRAGASRPVINQNQFGGVLGGPVKKDKLFFFGSYQGTRQKNGASTTTYQPGVILPPIPAGDRLDRSAFQSALGKAFCPSNHPGDPRYGALGVNVSCDGSNINPVALNILQTKLPNGTYLIPSSTNGTFQNSPLSVPGTYAEDQYIANADYLLNTKNTLAGRFFKSSDPQTLAFTPICSGNCLDGFPAHQEFTNLYGTLKYTSVVSNSLVNDALFSFQRNYTNDTPLNTTITNPSVGITPTTPGINALSPMLIGGLVQIGGGSFDNQQMAVNTWIFSDQLSWVHGKHTVRVGGEIQRIQWNWDFISITKGALVFVNFNDFLLGHSACAPGTFPVTCNPGNPGNTTGLPVSNIIAEILPTRAVSPQGLVNGYRASNASGFIQDDIKFAPRFTLNLGLRWEYDGMPSDKYGNLTNIWLSQVASAPPGSSAANGTLTGWVVPANYQGTVPAGVLKSGHTIASRTDPSLTNFAPRIGFAWRPLESNRFVVRGGYGFFYDRIPGDSMIESVQLMPPYAGNASAQTAATFAQPFRDPGPGFPSRWVNFSTGASSQINQTTLAEQFFTPLVYSYNLNFQYEVAPGWVAEVGYVGSHGIHQFTSGSAPNAPYLASAAAPINGVTTNTTSNYLLRVPYLGLSQNFTQEATNGDFKFNSLQATLRKQFSRGLTLQAAYTFARAFSTGNLALGDQHNYRDQYGLNPQYRPQRLTVNYGWDIPYSNLKGAAAKLLGGWNLSGITTVQDGTPLTITDKNGASIFGLQGFSRAQICTGASYANIPTGGGLTSRLGGVSGGPGYLNSSAFCTNQLPQIGGGTGFGDSGIGVILGPGQFNWDVSLGKVTRVGGLSEDASLQFRAEFFNILNQAQFGNPAVAVDSPASFGQITGTSVNPRLIQFGLKYVF
jgi:hypothetical protein